VVVESELGGCAGVGVSENEAGGAVQIEFLRSIVISQSHFACFLYK
jgi:hypothetical protein